MHIRVLYNHDENQMFKWTKKLFELFSEDPNHPHTYQFEGLNCRSDILECIGRHEPEFNVIYSVIRTHTTDGVILLEKTRSVYPHIPVVLYSYTKSEAYNKKLVDEYGAFFAFTAPDKLESQVQIIDEAAEWNLSASR